MKFVVNDKNGKHVFNADKKCYWLTDEKGTVLTDEQIHNIKKAKTIAEKYCKENKTTVYINSYSRKINMKLTEATICFLESGIVCL